MKLKNAILRALIGFGAGVMTGYLTMLIVSVCVGGGEYIPALDRLVKICGGEMNAVLVQTVLTGLVGTAYALASFFFENRASLLSQFAAYFFTTFPLLAAVVLFCWMPEDKTGIISTVCTLPIGYVITFFVRLGRARQDVSEINSKIDDYSRALEEEK